MESSVYKNFLMLESLFLPNANRDLAVGMAKYMKNHFSFLGIPSPLRKELYKDFLKSALHNEILHWDFIQYLHQKPFREYHYISMELAWLKIKKQSKIEDAEFIEELIKKNAWWDTTDFLAAHVLGDYLIKFPEKTLEILAKFTSSNHLWLQRSTLLFSLFYKENTNWEILKNQILLLQNNKDFFIQKAIGWSLRQYAKTKPTVVFNFVHSKEFLGNSLAKKEALKHF